MRKNTLKQIEAVNKAIKEEGRLSVNRVKYILLQNHLISLSKYVYQGVSKKMVKWRELGLVNWKDIIDKRTLDIRPQTFESFDDAFEEAKRTFRFGLNSVYRNHVLVIIEKDTMTEFFEDVCLGVHVPLIVSGGFTSYTRKRILMEEIANSERPVVIIYAGDWDAEGLHIEQLLKDKFGDKVDFRRISVTKDDVVKHKDIAIAWTPKPIQARKEYVRRYRDAWGDRKWEAEMLPGAEHTRRLKEALNSVIDMKLVDSSLERGNLEIKTWLKEHYKE